MSATMVLEDFIEGERAAIAKHAYATLRAIADLIHASNEIQRKALRERYAPLMTQCINIVLTWAIDHDLYREYLPAGWWRLTMGANRPDVFDGMAMHVPGRHQEAVLTIHPDSGEALPPTMRVRLSVHPTLYHGHQNRLKVFGDVVILPT